MNVRRFRRAAALSLLFVVFSCVTVVAQDDDGDLHATGTFDVQITQLESGFDDAALGRMKLTKTIQGAMAGTSVGQMLTAMTEVEGSAAYVAIEKFTGTVDGKSGAFMLQHFGTMTQSAQELKITTVPDSGTGELVGIRGSLSITIDQGVHAYDLTYSFADGD